MWKRRQSCCWATETWPAVRIPNSPSYSISSSLAPVHHCLLLHTLFATAIWAFLELFVVFFFWMSASCYLSHHPVACPTIFPLFFLLTAHNVSSWKLSPRPFNHTFVFHAFRSHQRWNLSLGKNQIIWWSLQVTIHYNSSTLWQIVLFKGHLIL